MGKITSRVLGHEDFAVKSIIKHRHLGMELRIGAKREDKDF